MPPREGPPRCRRQRGRNPALIACGPGPSAAGVAWARGEGTWGVQPPPVSSPCSPRRRGLTPSPLSGPPPPWPALLPRKLREPRGGVGEREWGVGRLGCRADPVAASDSRMGHLHGIPKSPTGLSARGRPRLASGTKFCSTRLAARNTRAARARGVGVRPRPRGSKSWTLRCRVGSACERNVAWPPSSDRGSQGRSTFL